MIATLTNAANSGIHDDAMGNQTAKLASVPLFKTLSHEELAGLVGMLRRRRYRRGEVIFLTGDIGMNLCIIVSGQVKLVVTSESQGREVGIDYLAPGEVFGELSLLDGESRSSDAIAVEQTELLLLRRDDFLVFLEHHPRVAMSLLGYLSRRLRRDTQLIQDMAFLDVPARLARVVLKLATPQPDGALSTPRINQSDLAGLVCTTRETLNKFLGIFGNQGLLRWEANHIVVYRPDELRKRIY